MWAFLGDGETDEPEALGHLGEAAREGLDNLTFVVNCNLQRLDGPVRGNGKIIQELSRSSAAPAGTSSRWWGPRVGRPAARTPRAPLVNLMNDHPDGDYQTFKGNGAYVREHFFNGPAHQGRTGQDLRRPDLEAQNGRPRLPRSSTPPRRLEHKGQPTVILAKTMKGWTWAHTSSPQRTHQMKKLTLDDLLAFRDRLQIPFTDDQIDANVPRRTTTRDRSPQIKYMLDRRRELGGFCPDRQQNSATAAAPCPR